MSPRMTTRALWALKDAIEASAQASRPIWAMMSKNIPTQASVAWARDRGGNYWQLAILAPTEGQMRGEI